MSDFDTTGCIKGQGVQQLQGAIESNAIGISCNAQVISVQTAAVATVELHGESGVDRKEVAKIGISGCRDLQHQAGTSAFDNIQAAS